MRPKLSSAEQKRRAAKRKTVGNFTDRKEEAAGRKLALSLLRRPKYLATLKKKLDEGSAHPSVENSLWCFAFGRPKEIIETTAPVPVRVEHHYDER